jgi:hypothetical protein
MLWTWSDKTDRSTVGDRRWFPINRRCYHQAASAMYADKPPSGIDFTWPAAKGRESGVVEGFRSLQIIAANHYVSEHWSSPVSGCF